MADIDPNLAAKWADLMDTMRSGADVFTSSVNKSADSQTELDKANRDSAKAQATVESELKKFGKSINTLTGDLEDDDEQIKKRIKIQKEVNDILEKNLKTEAEAKGVSVESLKLQKQQNTAQQDQLSKLKDQLDSTVVLTKAQYDSINAAELAIKAKSREIDNLKNADRNYASMITSITSVSGAIDAYKKKQLEAAEGNVEATSQVVAKFALLEVGMTAVSAGFNYLVDSTKAAYEGMMSYNRALVTGADGATLASTQQLAVMKAQQKSLGDASGSFLNVGKAAGAAGVAMLGVAVLGGPVSLVALALTSLAAILGFGAAAYLKQEEMAQEKANQDLELGNMLKDKLYTAYMDIGKAGLVGSRGMTALAEDAHKAGFAIKDIDKFTSVLKNSQKEMSLFAGGAAAGVDKFAAVTGEMTDKLGDHFRNLGISVEEQAEETAKYMALQSRLGLIQGKTVDQLAKGAGVYLEELDKTATLLGTSRKEQEDARGAVLGIEQLRAAMMAAEDSGDKEESERLGRYLQQATELQSKGLVKEAAGLAKLGATKGAATDKDTVIARQTFSNDYLKKLDNNIGSQTDQTRQLAKELKNNYSRSALGYARTGVDSGMTGGTYGKAAEFSKAVENQEAAAREAAAKKGLKEGSPEYNKFFEEFLVTQKTATDKATTDAAKLREKQQQDNIAEDKRLISFADKYAGATNIFSDAVNKFVGKGTAAANQPSGAAAAAPADITYDEMGNPISSSSAPAVPAARVDKRNGGQRNVQSTPAPVSPHRGSQSGTATGGASGAKIKSSNAALKEAGLTIKKGDVQGEGREIDPKLIEIAKQVQANIPGFMQFTGFNDQYHNEKAPGSKHKSGEAFDFVLSKAPTKEEGLKIIDQLKSMGIDYAQDEYNNASANATGGHIHGQLNDPPKAYDGGLFEGPKSGYQVELHGREAIVPLPDPASKIKVEEPTKDDLSSVVSNTTNSVSENASSSSTNDMIAELIEMMTNKMDDMIDKLDKGNTYSDKLVKAMV